MEVILESGSHPADRDRASALRTWIAAEREAIVREATALTERFWDRHWAAQGGGDKQQRGYLGVRVRRRGEGVYIEWYRSDPPRGRRGSSGSARVFHRYLARGKGHAYPMKVFRGEKARDWELDLARELESRFGPLRMRLELLTRIERQAREYDRALGLAKSGTCGESAKGEHQGEPPDARETGNPRILDRDL